MTCYTRVNRSALLRVGCGLLRSGRETMDRWSVSMAVYRFDSLDTSNRKLIDDKAPIGIEGESIAASRNWASWSVCTEIRVDIVDTKYTGMWGGKGMAKQKTYRLHNCWQRGIRSCDREPI